MKRTVLIQCITFIIGIFIGGLIVSIYFSKSIKAMQNISEFHYRTDLEDVAFKAYSHQSPEFAIWALEKLINVLENEKDIADSESKKLIQMDLIISYARLAISAKAAKDNQRYKQSISKSLYLAKEYYPKDIHTEEDLLSYIKRLDDVAQKSQN